MFHTSEKLLHDELHILKKGGVNPQILMKSDDLYILANTRCSEQKVYCTSLDVSPKYTYFI